MSRVFISYAQEDRELVADYIGGLESAGWNIWWDRELHGGDDWSDRIDAELQRADCVVIFWSRYSVESPWVRIEAHHAKQQGCIIPVRLDNVELPDEYRSLQTIDGTSAVHPELLATISKAITALLANRRNKRLRSFGLTTFVVLVVATVLLLMNPVGSPPEAQDSAIAGRSPWQALQEAATLEQFDQVASRFADMRLADPGSTLAHAGLCQTYIHRYRLSLRDSDLAMAQGSCATANELDQASAFSAQANGWLAHYTGNYQQAIEEFERAVSMDASSAGAWMGLAAAQEALGNYAEAERALAEATVAQPGLWRAQNAMASFLQRQGRLEQSIRRYELAQQLAPGNISVLNNLGVSRLFNRDYAGAIAEWSQVMELTPQENHGPTLTNIGSAYYLMHDYGAARIAFEKASRMQGDDYRAWANLADTLAALDESEAAVAAYRRALDRAELILAQNAADAYALASAASFKSALGEQGWRQEISAAIAQLPEDPEVRRLATLCYLRAGDFIAAAAQYAKTLALGYPEFMLAADYQFAAVSGSNLQDK